MHMTDVHPEPLETMPSDSRRSLRLIIPGIPPPLNAYRRMHHMQQYKDKQVWQKSALFLACQAVRLADWGRPKDRVRITAIYHYPDNRRRDPDGAVTGLKGVLDGLVKAGVMLDDDFGTVELLVRRGDVHRHNPCVEIIVEEVTP